MKVYFTETQVPELAALNRSQRKIVRHGAFEMLRRNEPSLLGSFRLLTASVVFISFVIGVVVVHAIQAEHKWILRAIVVGIIAHVAVLIAKSFITERLRPYFRLFMEQHRDEIATVA